MPRKPSRPAVPTVRLRLPELMEAAGVNQAELARRAGLTPVGVHRMLSTTNPPRRVEFVTLAKLCHAFGCPPSDLLTDKPAQA